MIPNKNKFAINEVYYAITYSDLNLCYPQVTTFNFLGINLFDEDLDTWYFQFLDHDKALKSLDHHNAERENLNVRCLNSEELDEMFDLGELFLKLTEAKERRSKVQTA